MYGAQVSKDRNVVQAQPPAVAVGVRTPPQMSSPGLLRYRSAPSSVLGDACGDHAAADTVIARFLASGGGGGHSHHHEIRDNPHPSRTSTAAYFADDAAASMVAVASHQHQHHQQQQLMYQSQQQMAAMEGLYRTVSSGGGTEPAAGNSLLRQSSSPAGFLNHLTIDNGYGNNSMLRTAGSIGGGGFRSGGGDARLKGQLSFSSRQGSVMSQISEVGSEELGGSSSPEACSNGGGGAGYSSSIPGYPMGSAAAAGWEEDEQPLPPSGAATKRPRTGDAFKPSVAAGASPEMAAIEKFLQFQDAVPCKIRAKRGCATHPRSIAERVRRTRISERIRKLQELVPNMEKQTNTSDMLDLAVDYIKELQKHVKVLNDGRANCTCSASKHNHFAC